MLKVLFSWYDWSALCVGVVGLKPKWSQRPIMTKNNILRSQWELLVETCELSEARENLNDQGAIGFSFPSDWLREGCGYLDQSHRKVMQKWLSIPDHFRYSIGHFTVFSIFYLYVHLYFFVLPACHVSKGAAACSNGETNGRISLWRRYLSEYCSRFQGAEPQGNKKICDFLLECIEKEN